MHRGSEFWLVWTQKVLPLWRAGDKGCCVRMQWSVFEKYSVLEQGKSWADRQTGINFPPSWVPPQTVDTPDTDSRLCFTFTSICRARRERERRGRDGDQETLSHIRFLTFFYLPFSSKLSLSCPPPLLPRSHSVSLSLPLSLLPSFPLPLLFRLLWSVLRLALLRLPLLCSPILF